MKDNSVRYLFAASSCNQEITNFALLILLDLLIDHGNTDCNLLIAYLFFQNGGTF